MRYFNRDQMEQPKILFSPKAEEAQADLQDFIARTMDKGETRRVPSSEWLLRDENFRKEMAENFDHVCAYCESLANPDWADVDPGVASRHRPGSLAQDEEGNTDFLAYSWLMYDWENQLWLCTDCARRKGNRFYIEGKRGEPGMPIKELREFEQELMLDPCFHSPSQHLAFQLNGSLNWKTAPGHATTEVLALDRDELVEARRATNIALLNALRDNRGKLPLHPTGADYPDDRYCFSVFLASGSEDNSSGRPIYDHRAAAANALLAFARFRGMQVEDLPQFLSLLADLDHESREDFLQDAFNEASGQTLVSAFATEPEEAAPPIKAVRPLPRPSRVPDIRKMPVAQLPISRVSISNFRALREITFDLPNMVADPDQSPCMILLGENATGKSSVLEAMSLAIIGAREARELDEALKDEELSPADLIHRPDPSDWTVTAPEMRVELRFQDRKEPVLIEAEPADSAFEGDQDCAKIVLAYGPRRYFTNKKTRRFRAPAHRVRSLFDPMDMIANPIHWLTSLDGRAFDAAARALRVILMLDNEDDFERDDSEEKRGQIFISQSGQPTALRDLSVGYKSVIAMACDIIRELLYHFDNLEFADAVVFIDEIETHLHPRWKMQIMQLMRSAFPRVQFIVTTHDPLCLRGMYNGEVFVLQRSAHDAQIEQLTDLPSIRGMRAEQILTSEFFGLGSTDPETDAKLERYNLLAARIEQLTDAEREEMERLSDALDDNLVIGSTLREQAYAEAVKEQSAKTQVEPTLATSPRRKDLKARFASLFEGPADR